MTSNFDDVEPWEQQPGEGPQAFQAFKVYLDMGVDGGKRSTGKVRLMIGKNRRLVEKWCSRWRWVDRAREYTRYIDRLARQKKEKEILDFRKRVAQQARGKAQSLMLPDMAISAKLSQAGIMDTLVAMPLSELVELSSRCAFALPNLIKVEATALGDLGDPATGPAEPDDFLTRRIQEDDDLMSIAATLIERASALGPGSGQPAARRLGDGGEPAPMDESAVDGPESEAGLRTARSGTRIVRSVHENFEIISSPK